MFIAAIVWSMVHHLPDRRHIIGPHVRSIARNARRAHCGDGGGGGGSIARPFGKGLSMLAVHPFHSSSIRENKTVDHSSVYVNKGPNL